MIAFENFNEDSRIKAIRKAKQSILWVTPNILPSEADALIDMEHVLGQGNVECIIGENIEKDSNIEKVFYVETYLSSIEKLKSLKCKVKVLKNLKLGLIICDNIIYSFNYNIIDQNKGISCITMAISEENLKETYVKAKKDILNGQIENELNEKFSVELKNEILKDKNNILLMLRDYVQCVNMTFHGVRIVDKRINVSSFLKKYAFKNKEYKKDIKVDFKVFDGIQSIKDCSSEFNKFALKIKKEKLIKIEDIGFIIAKRRKKDLESSLEKFFKKQKLEMEKSKKLKDEICDGREKLKKHLLSLLKDYSINKNISNTIAIEEELKKIPDSNSIIDSFSYTLNYYDISIDMINNKEFYKQLIRELKEDNILDFLPDKI